eukprot:IDg16162t1
MYSNKNAACKGHKITGLAHAGADCANLETALAQAQPYRATSCTIIKGLFQCAKVAAQGRKAIVHVLEKQTQAIAHARSRIARFRKKEQPGTSLVAMHVRRGDYTKRFNQGLLEPLPIEYYRAAMRLLPYGKNSTFLVFSDDINWCREQFVAAKVGVVRIHFVHVTDPIEALLTMALADHHIIANSTFSWWAAFLYDNTRKITVAPSPCFQLATSKEMRQQAYAGCMRGEKRLRSADLDEGIPKS